jgi:hypothetical protein
VAQCLRFTPGFFAVTHKVAHEAFDASPDPKQLGADAVRRGPIASAEIIPPARGALTMVVDTCELGRPVHVLDRFCELVHDDLPQAVDGLFTARGGPTFKLGRIENARNIHTRRCAGFSSSPRPGGSTSPSSALLDLVPAMVLMISSFTVSSS